METTTATRTRQPKGITTGGQFAAEHKPEATAVLGAPERPAPESEADLPTGDWSAVPTKERAAAMLQDLDTAISTVVAEGKLSTWMDSMRSNGMGRWSFNNRALASMQLMNRGVDLSDPSQVHLMGFRQWEKMDRRVKKGAKAVYILAPTAITLKDKQGKPLLDENGNEKKFHRFKAIPVFNVTDTEGEALPEYPAAPAAGEVRPGVLTGLRDRVATAGYAYSEKETASDPARGLGTLGFTSPEGYVSVDPRLSEAQKASTIAHELAHIKCGHIENISEYRTHRGRMETEAEMTAYLVNRELGMDAEDADSFSPAYIAGWSEGDPKVIRAAMSKATNAYLDITGGTWPGEDSEEMTRAPVVT
ncbi:ImmA/IrrE family metallo-endopeptidase (plasmid) [Citricoccus nitrophenolicus]